jgi:hypothetical protein
MAGDVGKAMRAVMWNGWMRHLAMPALLACLLAAGPRADVPAPAAVADGRDGWLLLYVGAEDCAPCRAWREAQWDRVRRAHRAAPLRFLELRAERAADVLDDALWPSALRPHRAAIPPQAGLPLWMLAREDRVVLLVWGARRWDAELAPALRRIARGADLAFIDQ